VLLLLLWYVDCYANTREGRSSGSSIASREGGRDGAGAAAPAYKDAQNAGKENRAAPLQRQEEQGVGAGAGSGGKVAGTPKGSLKGKKPPSISTEPAAAEINTRSPLNLIRSWEKHDPAADAAAAAKAGGKAAARGRAVGKGGGGERGSSAEDESTDVTGASASEPPTPTTPAGGYTAVLDSVRDEILQAESVMAQVTSTFGVDRSLSLHRPQSLSLSLRPSLLSPSPSTRFSASFASSPSRCETTP